MLCSFTMLYLKKESEKHDIHNLKTDEICANFDTPELRPVKHKKNLDSTTADGDSVLYKKYKTNNIHNINLHMDEDANACENISTKRKKKRDKTELKTNETYTGQENLESFDLKRKKHKKKHKNRELINGDFCISETNNCVEQIDNNLVSTDKGRKKTKLDGSESDLSILLEKHDIHNIITNEICANLDISELKPVKHKKNLDSNINLATDADVNACEKNSTKGKKKRDKTELKTNETCTGLESFDLKRKKHKKKHKNHELINGDFCISETNNCVEQLEDNLVSTDKGRKGTKLDGSESDLSVLLEKESEKHDIHNLITDEICANFDTSELRPVKHKKNLDSTTTDGDSVFYKKYKTNNIHNINLPTDDDVNDINACEIISTKRKKKHDKTVLKTNETCTGQEDLESFDLKRKQHKKKDKNRELINGDFCVREINNCVEQMDNSLVSTHKGRKRTKLDDSESDLSVLFLKESEKHDIHNLITDKICANFDTSELRPVKHKKNLDSTTADGDSVFYKKYKTSNIHNINLSMDDDVNDINACEIISTKRKKKHDKTELKTNETCTGQEDLESFDLKRKKHKKKDKNRELINGSFCVSEINNCVEQIDNNLVSTDKGRKRTKLDDSESDLSVVFVKESEKHEIHNLITDQICTNFDTSELRPVKHKKKHKKGKESLDNSTNADTVFYKHKAKNIDNDLQPNCVINDFDACESNSGLNLKYLDKSKSKKHKQKNKEIHSENEKNASESYQSLMLLFKSVDNRSEVEELLPADNNIKHTDTNDQNSSKTMSNTENTNDFQPILSLDFSEDPVDFKVPILHEKETVTRLSEIQKRSFLESRVFIKMGKFTLWEDEIIKKNFEDFVQKYRISDPLELFGIGRYGGDKSISKFVRAKHFYVRLGKGLDDRTLHSIYRRARLILHPSKTMSKMDATDQSRMRQLQSRFHNKWTHIADILNREPDNCLQTYRWHEKEVFKGRWTEEEKNQLVNAIQKVSGSSELSCDKIRDINWNAVATHVPTRNFSQCRLYWANHFGWKSNSEKKKWDHLCYVKLLKILVNDWYVKESSMINWRKVHESFVDVAPTHIYLLKRWYHLKKKVPQYKTKSYKEILQILCEEYNVKKVSF